MTDNERTERERVARAIWHSNFHPDDVASGEADRRIAEWPSDWAKAQRQADAAIAALRSAPVDGLVERLEELVAKATPGDLMTAEFSSGQVIECPICQGDGEVEAKDFCNFDGKALGVQFYGIGEEFGAHEALWSELANNLPTILTALRAQGQDERAEIVAWLRADADLTEAEAVKIVRNTTGDPRKNAAEWAGLVATKRGIADAIEAGQHKEGNV